MRHEFPDAPLRVGNAPLYGANLQQTVMSAADGSAAVSLTPLTEHTQVGSLAQLLEPPPPPPTVEEPVPEATGGKGKGKK